MKPGQVTGYNDSKIRRATHGKPRPDNRAQKCSLLPHAARAALPLHERTGGTSALDQIK
jgi:hypothetical protein